MLGWSNEANVLISWKKSATSWSACPNMWICFTASACPFHLAFHTVPAAPCPSKFSADHAMPSPSSSPFTSTEDDAELPRRELPKKGSISCHFTFLIEASSSNVNNDKNILDRKSVVE